jgi:hypothetical protein
MTAGGGLSRRKFMLGAAAGLAADASRPAIGLARAGSGPVPVPLADPEHLRAMAFTAKEGEFPEAPDFRFRWAGEGRYTRADRPWDGIDIKYIVIHDTEATYDQTLDYFHGPSGAGGATTHYVIRSWDGRITQMVPTSHIAFHTGNFWYNMHSIGIEHEGYLAHGHRWYTEAQYRSSAKLVRYLAARFGIPLDREHIIGHEEIPAEDAEHSAKQHYDPGPFWDWAYYFKLLGAPLYQEGPDRAQGSPEVVAVMPRFDDNFHSLTDCSDDCVDLPSQASNVVYLHTEPSLDAPLISDPALHTSGRPGTSQTWDWSARAMVGQRFVVADRRHGWTAIWFAGRRAWFADPDGRIGASATGGVITPAPGRDSIPVYGTAYPERSAFPTRIVPDDIVPLQYRIPAGQRYVAVARYRSDDYQGTAAHPDARVYVVGDRRLVEISYNHRRAFVDANDVCNV